MLSEAVIITCIICISPLLAPAPFAAEPMNSTNKEEKAKTDKDPMSSGLPNETEMEESLGLARKALKREKIQVLEERKRLEFLRKEVMSEIERLSALLEPLDSAKDKERKKKIQKMTKVLAAMTPAAASHTLSSLDDTLVVELLSSMNSKLAAKILENLKPEHSAALIMAVINKSVAGKDPENESEFH